MAEFALDATTGIEADLAAKGGSDTAAKQQAYYNVVRNRFNSGARILIYSTTSTAQITIPLPAGAIVGTNLRFNMQTTTAVATAPIDLDSGTWAARIYASDGVRYISSLTVPPVGRSAPAGVRIFGGSTAAGALEFAEGMNAVTTAEINIALPPASDFGSVTPEPEPETPGSVPAAILAMASAPAPSKWTTGASVSANSWTPNGAEDLPQQIYSGGYDAEFQDVFVGSSQWDLSFSGADVSAGISGNQFRGRCGIGSAVGRAVSWRVQTRLPTEAAIGAYKRSPPSEVVCYPNCYSGKRLGGTSGWPSQRADRIQQNVPIQFKNIRSHWIGAKSWSLSALPGGVLGTGWIAHDMRVCSSGRATVDYKDIANILLGEVMVTRRHFPADRNLAPDSRFYGEYTIGGSVFRLVIFRGSGDVAGVGKACLIQLRTVGGLPNHFPMHEVWRFLTSRTYRSVGNTGGPRIHGQGVDDPLVSPNSWYHQCGTGIEMEHDTYDLQVDTYYDRMNLD